MFSTVEDLKRFYDSDIGQIVRELISAHIYNFWPDVHGQRILGCGYSTPYLSLFHDEKPERLISMMPNTQGGHLWPDGQRNLVFMSDEAHMPLEPASIDRLLLVHYLENCSDLNQTLREAWRVLKANGRILIVVPNRMGAWAHADWSPFGRGRPFTIHQICSLLQDHRFMYEQHQGGLFMLPLPNSAVMMKLSHFMERMGKTVLPFVAGVHVVEFSKQIYARAGDSGSGSAVVTKTQEILAGKAKPVPQNFNSRLDLVDR